MKRYILAFKGPECEFEGNAADKRFYPSDDDTLDITETSFYGNLVNFSGKGRFRIVRARLSMLAAEGVHSGSNGVNSATFPTGAAIINFALKSYGTGIAQEKEFCTFSVPFSKWGEWEDKQIEVEPHGVGSDWEGTSGLDYVNRNNTCVMKADSRFSLDDFNIQDDFVSQIRNVMVELEIEADAILDASTGEAI